MLSFLRPEEVYQTLVTPELCGEVEEAFRVAVDGLGKPVHHGAADAGGRVHILAGNTGLAVAHGPFTPYPVDGMADFLRKKEEEMIYTNFFYNFAPDKNSVLSNDYLCTELNSSHF